MDDRTKIACPVCTKTMGFVEKTADGVIEMKCPRCHSVTKFSLLTCEAILKRLASGYCLNP